MNNLLIKTVDFFGDTLQVAKDNDGTVWAGVRWICEGIGLSEDQTKNERKKIQSDLVISRGGSKITLPTNGGEQEVLCLQLDFIPLWLAKISITPTMQAENPTLVDKLVRYQLKAKDVLAAAFILPTRPMTQAEIIAAQAQVMVDIERRQVINEEKIESIGSKVDDTNKRIDGIGEIIALNPNAWRQDAHQIINKIASNMGGFDYYKEVNSYVYNLLDARAGVNLETRLTNKRRRMAEEGTSKSKRDKINKLDVIAEDKRLIEIYIAIVKEMAIKYRVA